MSSRERNLLILLVSMAFIAVNFLGYRMWYQPKMDEMMSAKDSAERSAAFNETEAASLEFIQDDRDWLSRVEPKPSTAGQMATRIQQLSEKAAVQAGLTVKRKSFGDEVVDSALSYHRVRFQIEVNGPESSIYRWLDKIHDPNLFRAVTFVRLSPQRDDATRADCEIYLDQWFVPEGGKS